MEQLFKNMGVWVDKPVYEEAERLYYEKLAKQPPKKVSLAGEVAKARERIKQSLENFDDLSLSKNSYDPEVQSKIDAVEDKVTLLRKDFDELKRSFISLEKVVKQLDAKISKSSGKPNDSSAKPSSQPAKTKDDDDDVDLFGSDSEGEDEEAERIKEERLAAYAAKKSKKPVLIAKSNIILDVKPWDDETDMKDLEKAVRQVEMDGLVWGASKLVPLAYGIKKLQISCVVEDEKVSVDELQEKLQEIEDYVQSVDIAAFNKV
ncbi:hypothetical protein V9T40_001849 [Parthenolecanium corni]|uniref:Elongation factor 1-delta n=1 Tax=Parthenolecanium corni TaxID=536013 RepID=A0AAN9Y399_9HEMI